MVRANAIIIMSVMLTVFFFADAKAGEPSSLQLDGFADWFQSVRIKEPNDLITSRTRVRLELKKTSDNSYVFASFNAIENKILPDDSGVHLREAFLKYESDKIDLTAGRQIIVWGKADGVQVSDVISPMDYTEFLTREYDDIRVPVSSLRCKYNHEIFNAEIVWLPVFEESTLPEGNNPWAVPISYPTGFNVIISSSVKPERTIYNSELGGKVSFYLSGIDFSVSCFNGFNRIPTVYKAVDPLTGTLNLTPKYERMQFVGCDFSFPWEDFVIRGEAAHFNNMYFDSVSTIDKLYPSDTLKGLIGIDWYPGADWMFIVQGIDERIVDYNDDINSPQDTSLLTVDISKKLFRQTLTLTNMVYVGLNYHDVYDHFSIEYALTDQVSLSVGTDLFSGEKGMMSFYRDNSQYWAKARYGF